MYDKSEYERKITSLENEISYLHKLLDNAGIPYSFQDKSASENITIIPEQITPRHAQYFYSIFKGRRDVYAKRGGKPNPQTGKVGYYTQCHNFWKDGLCPKKYGQKISCSECQNQHYKELTVKALMEHLQGGKADCSDVIGMYAMFPDETCNFLIFDFDNHDDFDDSESWMDEINAVRQICKNNNVPILVERSRSGKGAHIWMFFREPIPASTARQFGSALLTKGAESVNLKSFHYYDRMIPAQDHLPINAKTGKVGLGNLVALPFQGQALRNGNSAFIDENNQAYPDQWQVLREVRKIEKSFIEQSIQAWSTDGNLGALSPDIYDNSDASKPWEKAKNMLYPEDIAGKVEIDLADRVYINTKNIKPRTQNYLRRMAAFKNPNFYKATPHKACQKKKKVV